MATVPDSKSKKTESDGTSESSLSDSSLFGKLTPASIGLPRNVLWTEPEDEPRPNGMELMMKYHVADEIDPRDKGTPDDWVPRHPALVRLTGRHPFNCEPPLSMLYDQGFITPISLHFVRSHGRTPRLNWQDHRISISGLVKTPMSLSMDELLLKLPKVTLPVTLACAGNRRKEQNMVKQTIGFNWGPSALACNLWTGVRLRDLLLLCGIDTSQARHVLFESSKNEDLPNGDKTYGTSIDVATAMDPYGDILIAWEQNGVRLTPDHGYPVRVIIPGFIGARSVKWLERIEVTNTQSTNHYHIFDNRVLPPHVDAELAKAEGWYYRTEYMINQLPINSTIVKPENGEVLKLNDAGKYTMKGYAYSGGGRKVTRVEVSFDGGLKWHLCGCSYPEETMSLAPQNGRYWCWMFWEYTINSFEFLKIAVNSGEIRCRAWDCASNTQPRDLTWNLMGMGNNCHFTVKVAPKQTSDGFGLQFLHPTVPGPSPGGWMKRPETMPAKTEGKITTEKPSSKSSGEPSKKFTMEEVEKHSTENSAWIVVENRVYDATEYLKDHPGGSASIMINAGMDATEEFLAVHSVTARKMLEDMYIGDLVTSKGTEDGESVHKPKPGTSATEDLVALNPRKWIGFELVEKQSVSHDTRMFKFTLQSPDHRLGLPVGYHMFVKAKISGETVMRAYTPVSRDCEKGSFTLCIKIYPDGKLTSYLDTLNIGDYLECRGPLGHFEYQGQGQFVLNGEKKFAKSIGLICGGTGLTPAYQVMSAVANDPSDETQVYLIYANKTVDDILLRSELDQMVTDHSNIHVWYTLDNPPDGWAYSSGFVSEQMLCEHLPSQGASSVVGMCGPKPMIDYACVPNLKKLGYQPSDYFSF